MGYSINQYNKFKILINNDSVEVITITANNGNGTSNGTTPSGNDVVVRGESVGVGNNAFVTGGVITSAAPNLTVVGIAI